MIKSIFSSVISNPDQLVSLSISDLRDVIKEFPYFSAAQLLLAKKLKTEDSVLFEKQLNLTAAYVPSRRILYNLIHGSSEELKTRPDPIEHKIEAIKEKKATQIDELGQLIRSESTSFYSLENIPEKEKTIEKIAIPKENQTLNFSSWLDFFEDNKIESLKSENDIIGDFIKEAPHIGTARPKDFPVENHFELYGNHARNALVV